MTTKKVVVYGSTGFTGGLVCKYLAQKQSDSWIIAGRNLSKLEQQVSDLQREYGVLPEVRVASVDDAQSLDDMLEGASVLINCAGPFTECGRPVVQAAIRNGVHYIDSTGEQRFMAWMLENCHKEAQARSVALLSGCAFEYAVGDFAVEFGLEKGARKIAVCYAAKNMHMSHGTKKSILHVLSQPGLSFLNGELVERKTAYRQFDVPFPEKKVRKALWIPGGESLFVPLRAEMTQVETCVAVGKSVADILPKLSGVLPSVISAIRPVADKLVEMTSGNPHEQSQDSASFLVIAFEPQSGEHFATLQLEDAYEVTAEILVEAAIRLRATEPKNYGFTSAAALFEKESFLEAVGIELVR